MFEETFLGIFLVGIMVNMAWEILYNKITFLIRYYKGEKMCDDCEYNY